jgi:glycine reductase
MGQIRVLHYLNQFFAGIGGEAHASTGPRLVRGAVGPGQILDDVLRGRGRVAATLVCGDDAFHADPEARLTELVELARAEGGDALVAGPAFDAGRYGVACGRLCHAVATRLGVPAVTAMFPENPGVAACGPPAYVLPAGESAASMRETLERLAAFALRLAAGSPVGPAGSEGYLPRGQRLNVFVERSAAERVVDLLLAKLGGSEAPGEIPLPAPPATPPAPPLADPARARIVLVTEGGIVPRGNPDGFGSRRATMWRKYPVPDSRLSADRYECVHAGFDTRWVQEDPNRVLPVDACRQLEREGKIGTLHEHYYVTVGVGTALEQARRFGREIAEELCRDRVDGAIMTAT